MREELGVLQALLIEIVHFLGMATIYATINFVPLDMDSD
jgi:hypothetical protein